MNWGGEGTDKLLIKLIYFRHCGSLDGLNVCLQCAGVVWPGAGLMRRAQSRDRCCRVKSNKSRSRVNCQEHVIHQHHLCITGSNIQNHFLDYFSKSFLSTWQLVNLFNVFGITEHQNLCRLHALQLIGRA